MSHFYSAYSDWTHSTIEKRPADLHCSHDLSLYNTHTCTQAHAHTQHRIGHKCMSCNKLRTFFLVQPKKWFSVRLKDWLEGLEDGQHKWPPFKGRQILKKSRRTLKSKKKLIKKSLRFLAALNVKKTYFKSFLIRVQASLVICSLSIRGCRPENRGILGSYLFD